jgi:hypothetical protein
MTPLLADVVLVAHGLFVLFIVAGLAAIWLGAACGWQWVRNFRFRAAHLATILFVALEALLGMACPLTVWEDALRGAPAGTSFIARWLHRVLFYSFPDWIFTTAYAGFALIVAVTWWHVRPQRPRDK